MNKTTKHLAWRNDPTQFEANKSLQKRETERERTENGKLKEVYIQSHLNERH